MSDEVVSDLLLLSLHPEHAERIYRGEKKAELRKTFPGTAKIVFVYETAPVSAVTGVFWVKHAIKTSIEEAIVLATAAGVGASRAEKYFEGHTYGWVIQIGQVIRFKRPIQLAELKSKNHYFSIPQTFAYLRRSEGLTQELMCDLLEEAGRTIAFRRLSETNTSCFGGLVKATVGNAYEDIDQDFLNQVLDRNVGLRAAFSTKDKIVFEVNYGEELMGFTVLTEKVYGAWKSGPTMLLPRYRGFGFGQNIRRLIEEFCRRAGGMGIYCTCAESQPATVSYLLNSGMKFQARLEGHLATGRAEFVFAKKLTNKLRRIKEIKHSVDQPIKGQVVQITSFDPRLRSTVGMFLKEMPNWYFKPQTLLGKAIKGSLSSKELGDRNYSAKGRSLFTFLDRRGQPRIAALLTDKRSQMTKINLVANNRSIENIRVLLLSAIKQTGPHRRIYLTVPVKELAAIQALEEVGFKFEGILQDPFGTGSNHVCYGYLPG